MSDQGFRGVPGVPEGWELVHAFRRGEIGEHGINSDGSPVAFERKTVFTYPIVRKIETPKKYRPFNGGAEFKPHRDRWVRIVSDDNNSCAIDEEDVGGDRRIDGCNEDSVCIWEGWMTYGEAFECFAFDDGTPFGVEVTE